MIPDLQFVRDAFSRFNRIIFHSELPEPSIEFTHARSFRGKMIYTRMPGDRASNYRLLLSKSFDLQISDWEDVVIHEMIHQYVAFKKIRDTSSHGPVFRKLMDDINRIHGRKITVSTRSTTREASAVNADNRLRAHYVCLTKFSDGRLLIMPVAKTKIFSLWDLKKYFPQIVSLKWIGSIDSFFNSFPHVQSPKLFLVDETELKAHLVGAVLLQREGKYVRPLSQRMTPDELLP